MEQPCESVLAGWVHCHVTPTEWKSHFQTVEYVTRPGSPISTKASFVLENGDSTLKKA